MERKFPVGSIVQQPGCSIFVYRRSDKIPLAVSFSCSLLWPTVTWNVRLRRTGSVPWRRLRNDGEGGFASGGPDDIWRKLLGASLQHLDFCATQGSPQQQRWAVVALLSHLHREPLCLSAIGELRGNGETCTSRRGPFALANLQRCDFEQGQVSFGALATCIQKRDWDQGWALGLWIRESKPCWERNQPWNTGLTL